MSLLVSRLGGFGVSDSLGGRVLFHSGTMSTMRGRIRERLAFVQSLKQSKALVTGSPANSQERFPTHSYFCDRNGIAGVYRWDRSIPGLILNGETSSDTVSIGVGDRSRSYRGSNRSCSRTSAGSRGRSNGAVLGSGNLVVSLKAGEFFGRGL